MDIEQPCQFPAHLPEALDGNRDVFQK